MKDHGLSLQKNLPMDHSAGVGDVSGVASAARGRLPYLPALDGLRGVAVLAVLLFHAELSWAVGGHLGVSTFFTLSGFLITGLLLLERDTTGRVGFGAFWARRARRLVPAMLLCFGLIAVVLPLMEGPLPSGLVGDAVGSASWLANWRFIFAERTYADVFASPSPFQHFWSLAVEEQFYVFFPLVFAAVSFRRSPTVRRWLLGAVLVGVVAASTVQMGRLYEPGDAIARAYYGTDARIAEILIGALLAVVLVGPTGVKVLPRAARHLLAVLGVLGLGGLAAAYVSLGERDAWLYGGGFVAVALCASAVIASSCQPGSPVGWLLSNDPLVRLGKISYGVYLFHWPIFLLLDERSTGLSPLPLFAVRAAVTVGIAALSFVLIESPVRHGRFDPRLAQIGWANGAIAAVALIAVASGQVVPAHADDGRDDEQSVAIREADPTLPPVTAPAAAPDAGDGTGPASSTTAPPAGQQQAPTTTQPAPDPGGGGEQVPRGFSENPEDAPINKAPEGPPGALRVAVVGDSIGQNLARGLAIWGAERGDVVVYDATVPGCPMSRGGDRQFGNGDPFPVSPICAWWDDPPSDRYRAFADFQPQVIVAQDGVNEMLDRRLPDWEDFRRPGDPRFDSWLRSEYDTALSQWIDSFGSAVVVTNAPCADWDRYGKFRSIEDAEVRIQALNTSVYPQLLQARVADLFQRVCPGGRYQSEVEGIPDSRPDGFHFTDEAAAALARNWLGPLVLEANEAAGPLLPRR